jgi:2'-hydroxyisoflavone reductase
MPINRRNFIKMSAATGAAINLSFVPGAFRFSQETSKRDAPAAGKATKPLNLLILGGTGFTGPHQVRYALARGHKVTVFNRGKTHPGELPKEVEQLIGDRNGKLDALKGRK